MKLTFEPLNRQGLDAPYMSAYAVSLTTPPEGGARGSHLPAHVGRGVPATSHKLGAARFVDLATCGPPSRP